MGDAVKPAGHDDYRTRWIARRLEGRPAVLDDTAAMVREVLAAAFEEALSRTDGEVEGDTESWLLFAAYEARRARDEDA